MTPLSFLDVLVEDGSLFLKLHLEQVDLLVVPILSLQLLKVFSLVAVLVLL